MTDEKAGSGTIHSISCNEFDGPEVRSAISRTDVKVFPERATCNSDDNRKTQRTRRPNAVVV